MIVAEELQCDWSKVKPQYASANRDAREMAPKWTSTSWQGRTDPVRRRRTRIRHPRATGVTGIPDSLYRRMRTNAAASVKDGRYYLQLAGAEARERLLWRPPRPGRPVEEVIRPTALSPTGRRGAPSPMAKSPRLPGRHRTPNPERIRIKPPSSGP